MIKQIETHHRCVSICFKCLCNANLLFFVFFFGWHCGGHFSLLVSGYVFVMFFCVLFGFEHFSDFSHD